MWGEFNYKIMEKYGALQKPRNLWIWSWGKKFGEFRYENEMVELQNFMKNKSIALIGNATSIFNTEKNIDKHDITCRINQTFPKTYTRKRLAHLTDEQYYNYKKYMGSRTDVFFCSQNQHVSITQTQYLIWCTYVIAPEQQENGKPLKFFPNLKTPFILFGQKEWYDLEEEMDCRPTNGSIAIYFLVNYINFKDLTLYGFDWWKTLNWTKKYKRTPNLNVHDYNQEKKFILNFMKKYPNIKRVEN